MAKYISIEQSEKRLQDLADLFVGGVSVLVLVFLVGLHYYEKQTAEKSKAEFSTWLAQHEAKKELAQLKINEQNEQIKVANYEN
ncbi:hypothetical protein ACFBZI_11770 [Moraxella sp. ZJ142]|uniref:hypothetical protein n=1 Tax=Moraxella marmotae TaxID=3344520 RepID=UPI0035D4D76A